MFRKFGKWILSGLFALVFLSVSGAAGLSVLHTAFPNADTSTEFGIPASVENMNTVVQTNMLSKLVITNNASNPIQIPNNTAYVIFAGTNVTNAALTISMPSATNALDNQEVSIYGQAAVSSVAVTVAAGASAVGGPSSAAANWHAKYKYDAASLSWYPVDN